MSASAQLRARTTLAHERVDTAFGAFDLGNHADYKAFLRTHARALRMVEKLLQNDHALPTSRARSALLEQDSPRSIKPCPAFSLSARFRRSAADTLPQRPGDLIRCRRVAPWWQHPGTRRRRRTPYRLPRRLAPTRRMEPSPSSDRHRSLKARSCLG